MQRSFSLPSAVPLRFDNVTLMISSILKDGDQLSLRVSLQVGEKATRFGLKPGESFHLPGVGDVRLDSISRPSEDVGYRAEFTTSLADETGAA